MAECLYSTKSKTEGGAEVTERLCRCDGMARDGTGDSGGGSLPHCSELLGCRKGEGARAGSEEDSNAVGSSGGGKAGEVLKNMGLWFLRGAVPECQPKRSHRLAVSSDRHDSPSVAEEEAEEGGLSRDAGDGTGDG